MISVACYWTLSPGIIPLAKRRTSGSDTRTKVSVVVMAPVKREISLRCQNFLRELALAQGAETEAAANFERIAPPAT